MKIQKLTLGFALAAGLASVTSNILAGEQKITGNFSSSYISTQIDTNGDGMPAVLSTGRAKTSLGSTTFQSVGESTGRLPTVSTCPRDNWEFPLLTGYGVVQFDDSGDLLFARYSSGTTCFDPITNTFTNSAKGTFEGGTGQFSKATGPLETTTTGRPLVADKAGHEFGSFSGQFAGTITIP